MLKTEWYKKRFNDIKEIFVIYPKKSVCVVLKNGNKGVSIAELGDKFSADYGVLMALLKAREVAAKRTATFTIKPFNSDTAKLLSEAEVRIEGQSYPVTDFSFSVSELNAREQLIRRLVRFQDRSGATLRGRIAGRSCTTPIGSSKIKKFCDDHGIKNVIIKTQGGTYLFDVSTQTFVSPRTQKTLEL